MKVLSLALHRQRAALLNRLADLLGNTDTGRFTDYIEGEEMTENKRLFTTTEAAELLLLHPETVRRFIREGTIDAVTIGSTKRIERTELERFWRERGGVNLFGDEDEGGGDE